MLKSLDNKNQTAMRMMDYIDDHKLLTEEESEGVFAVNEHDHDEHSHMKRSITTAKITKLIMMKMDTAKMNIARNMTSIFGLHLFSSFACSGDF